ncbi:hypothetical protein AZF37_09655 [endosymbiont 'TC1' of Trimyema compressum]|uniref:HdeD family acid-resistance protein n=1 Tax=endosymbiont 'TC1' of Trimyema compressum TaxID=243899 RepID=UPI0007F13237|nr:DUF308 domain-containing protein [endosymbiont 'TC1' of Trimyema compressum]AMP21381.1 hypothetical protein AZF37_09655 [endosymbiont 'TC1' of Trimyema compressum]
MEKVEKGWLSLVIGIAFIILGIVFMFNSNAAMNILNICISVVFIIAGVLTLIEFFRVRKIVNSYWLLFVAIMVLLIGIVLLFNVNVLAVLLPMILAIIIFAMGLLLFTAFGFKRTYFSSWWIFLIAAIISIVFALIIFFNLSIGAATITFFSGLYFLFVGCVSIGSFFRR